MSLQPVSIHIKRVTRTRTATAGKTDTEADVTGSPFTCRVYRVSQTSVQRTDAATGSTTIDNMRRISVMTPTADVKKGDIVYLPTDDDPSTTERGLVVRVRRYSDRVQCDLETGAQQGG